MATTPKPVPDSTDTAARATRPLAEPWTPSSDEDRKAILAHLDALVAHPLFFQSKRYPALLRFVVEQTLAGNAEQVKERSIGMEVFARAPGYDANADPVVRVTAGEIRKRLAQYYYDPANHDGIRIELPTGSYVPIFLRIHDSAPPAQQDSPAALAVSLPAASLSTSEPQTLAPISERRRLSLAALIPALAAAIAIGAFAGILIYRQINTPPPVDHTVDDFWQPLTAGPSTVTICLGEPARDSSQDTDPDKLIQKTPVVEPLYFHLHESGLFALADVTTLSRIAEPLQRAHKAFRVSAASEASFAQLREGPVVLIGAYDNLWTMRMTRDLSFGFDSTDGRAIIVDRKSNGKASWETAWDLPYVKLAKDYAIVARVRDGITGQPFIIASGIAEEGTEAAGELITDPAKLAGFLKGAPANWASMNMEAVIETQVIGGHSGPPKVLAVEYW